MTGYASGMRHERITILNPAEKEDGAFGRSSAGTNYTSAGSVYASVTFSKGVSAMNAGALDVYAVVMVRMNYDSGKLRHISPRSRIIYDGNTYQILGKTFHPDHINNTLQFNAQMIIE